MQESGLIQDSNLNQINKSEIRRRYPHRKTGIKDEWHAVVAHQQETANMIKGYEKDLKKLKQKEIVVSNDAKLAEKQYINQINQIEKKNEGDIVKKSVEMFQNELKNNQLEKKILYKHVDFYNESINHHKNQVLSKEKDDKKLDDIKRLSNIQALSQYDQMLREDKFKREANLKNEELKKYEENKRNRKIQSLQDQRDILTSFEIFNKKQELKNQNYQQFYNAIDKLNEAKLKIHYDKVYQKEAQKERELNDIIQKNIETEKMRKEKDEFERMQNRINKTKETLEFNKKVSENKLHTKSWTNLGRREDHIASEQSIQYHKEYIEAKKDDKAQLQKSYRIQLDEQKALRDELKRKEYKMSPSEKRLNYSDLQAFKEGDPRNASLVPGLLNSKISIIGLPKREFDKNPLLVDNSLGTQKKFIDGLSGLGPHQNPNIYTSANGVRENESDSKRGFSIENNLAHKNLSISVKAADNTKFQASMSHLFSPQHNPILNPVPVNMQNPYLLKQIREITSKNPF